MTPQISEVEKSFARGELEMSACHRVMNARLPVRAVLVKLSMLLLG